MNTKILYCSAALLGLLALLPNKAQATNLELINAVTDQPVGSGIIYIREYDLTETGNKINFRFNDFIGGDGTQPQIKSVRFRVTNESGDVLSERIENSAPFAAFGDSNGDYWEHTQGVGTLIIDARAFTEKHAQGQEIAGSTFAASFIRSPGLYGVAMVNADSNAVISYPVNGQSFSLSEIGNNLNFVSSYGDNADVRSVVFEQYMADGSVKTYVENVAPYAMFGDVGGDFKGKTFTPQTVSFNVTAYPGLNGTGVAIDSFGYAFNLVD